MATDGRNVIKLNDAVYYATWLEYLNSILIHNLIFPNTAYKLSGFIKEEGVLYAVVTQPYIVATTQAEISDIKFFLVYNEFDHWRRNDYINRKLGLLLEDMHDENVIQNSDSLFFIDSVFYTFQPGFEIR